MILRPFFVDKHRSQKIIQICLSLLLLFPLACNDASKPLPMEKSKSSSEVSSTVKKTRIIFFGDSLTAGYGLTDYEKSWPHLIGDSLKKDGFDSEIINAGVSGDTTSGGLGRIDWVLGQNPDIFVLELGANDMLRGISPTVTKSNLKEMVYKIKKDHPNCEILLVGMRATPNLGKSFRSEFDSIYPGLAKEEKLTLIPFLLEKVAGIRKLNQKDGIHPTEEGHVLVAKTVYPYLKKIVKKRQ